MNKFIVVMSTFLISCGTPASLAERDARTNDRVVVDIDGTPHERLAYMLRRQAGVTVNGDGQNYSVTIRGGVNSFQSNATPLFVVNGNQVSDFSGAAQAVGTNEVRSIRVLKDSDATVYGIRGSGGVIEIKTKSTVNNR